MTDLIEKILASVISGALLGIAGFFIGKISAKYKRLKDNQEDLKETLKVLKDANRHLLRKYIKECHEQFVNVQGWCSVEDKSIVDSIYQTYHVLKGNGTGTTLWEEIMALPSYPPRGDEA
jgi:hypothetical protein